MQLILQALYLDTSALRGFIAWSSQLHLGTISQKEKKMEKVENGTGNFNICPGLLWIL